MEGKKNKTNGVNGILIVIIVILLGVIAFCAYKIGTMGRCVVDDSNLQKGGNTSVPVENENSGNESSNKNNLDSNTYNSNMDELKEGYVLIDDNKNNQYKIYGIGTYANSYNYAIVSYNNNLYNVSLSFGCVFKIPEAQFDSSNNYTCKSNNLFGYIHKYNGKADDLVKVASSISYYSTDGSRYPILIYKNGNIESTYNETNEALKNYRIKDFISEECKEFKPNSLTCIDGKLEYKVILKDETKKTIIK